ncbi:RNA 3'-terminal phosphate cyclase [Colletotrichum trifolii]|uniref:RNA 3'-terminal phosphate cyclase n=1 Tax=Colletotrichum trifolii TaxID=5466 RepID=A0A4R8RT50_COLTR|nr:RNA 3'-terminal phosphate cyclase [Colletotrichum trifolii]
MKSAKPIEIDGRTGEGGGQLVRVAIALAAVTSQPVRITNVRGNRPAKSGSRGGDRPGLKAQHVTAIRWLAEITDADVDGLEVGSTTLTFCPRLPPPTALEGKPRFIRIAADSDAASTLLILQAILPFLLYAPDTEAEPTPFELELTGGTNVSFSLSYEYLDQVLLPRLQDVFGVRVDRRLKRRGWSLGSQGRGSICLTIRPLKRGEALRLLNPGIPIYDDPADFEVKHINVSMIVPSNLHAELQNTLSRDITAALPGAEISFELVEDSGHAARIYVLLVARSASGRLRWGRDVLMSPPKKGNGKNGKKGEDVLSSVISQRVVGELVREVTMRGSTCDEYLQDQLVIFQVLAEGRTSFPGGSDVDVDDATVLQQDVAKLELGERMRRDRTDKPIGDGSMHSQTAKWVASQILPGVEWYNKGAICQGAGTSFS